VLVASSGDQVSFNTTAGGGWFGLTAALA
jgi:hypothetical protein